MNLSHGSDSTQIIYCDYAATGPIRPQVLAAMNDAARLPGNPSSIHRPGQVARVALERARRNVARVMGAQPSEVVFTSGGTEANNTVLLGTLHPGDHVVTTKIEHPSVSKPLETLARRGVEVTAVAPAATGEVTVESVASACRPNTRLISVMAVNNETGVVNDLAALGALAAERGLLLHTDAVQAFGKLPLDVNAWGIHFLAASAHKIGGPKGVGLLYIHKGSRSDPLIWGGSQEHGQRGGTENLAGAVGFAEASNLALAGQQELAGRLTTFRGRFLERLAEAGLDHRVNGADPYPGVLNIHFPGVPGQSLVMNLDSAGLAVSYGSSCASGSSKASHVLTAMGLSPGAAEQSVRISFGYDTSAADVEAAAGIVIAEVARMIGAPFQPSDKPQAATAHHV